MWRDLKFERYRFRDFFSVPNFFETDSETFFGTKIFQDRFRDFFRYQNFSRPIPRLFSVLIFFETDSETFFGTKFFRDRFRYHPKKCKNPGNGTRPGPKSTQIIWKISRLVPIFFFGTKFFRDRFRDFFRYLIFPRPVPRLFSVPIFFETGSETFFGTKFFRFRFRYHQKNWRIPGNGNSRDRDVTLYNTTQNFHEPKNGLSHKQKDAYLVQCPFKCDLLFTFKLLQGKVPYHNLYVHLWLKLTNNQLI